MHLGYRLIWVLTLCTFLVMSSGCATSNLRLVDEELARTGTGLHKEKGQSIDGYLLHDGTMAEYKGRVRLADQDSLAFGSESYSDEVMSEETKKKIKVPGPVFALKAVKALEVTEARTAGTVLLVVTGIIVVVVVYGLATLDTMEYH